MREFFRGWRRKVGCVTLVMACLAMVGWMRGRVAIEAAVMDTGNRQSHVILLFNDQLVWYQWRRSPGEEGSTHWVDYPYSDSKAAAVQAELDLLASLPGMRRISLPLLPLSLSLTLLSAYLILRKRSHSVSITPQPETPHA